MVAGRDPDCSALIRKLDGILHDVEQDFAIDHPVHADAGRDFVGHVQFNPQHGLFRLDFVWFQLVNNEVDKRLFDWHEPEGQLV